MEVLLNSFNLNGHALGFHRRYYLIITSTTKIASCFGTRRTKKIISRDEGHNVCYFCVVSVVFVVVVETQQQSKEWPITAHAQLKEKQEREPRP